MANNEEIIRGIFQVGIDMKEVDAGMDKLVGKFKGTTKEVNNQVVEMQKLVDMEADLVAKRAKTQNPTAIVQYNNKLKEVRKSIEELNTQNQKFLSTQKANTAEANVLGKSLKNAFSATTLLALKKELNALGVEFSSVSSGAKDFLKNTKEGGDKGTDAFKKLKEQIRLAKIELAEAFKGGDQEQIQAASEKLGKLKDDFNDLSEAAKQFESSSKFTQIGKSITNIGSSLLSLDFEKANKQAKTLLAITQGLTFKEAAKGIADLGSTLLTVGKALLLNPIFLIGAAVVLIVQNFDALKKSGGAVGTVFRAVGQVMDGFKFIVESVTDALGLTTVALDKLAERQKIFLEKTQAIFREASDFIIGIQKAQGRQTLKEEVRAFEDQKRFAEMRIKLIEDEYKRKGIPRKQFSEEDKKLLEELQKQAISSAAQTAIAIQTAITTARNKVRELRNAVAEEAGKNKAFDVEFRLKPLSKAQIQAAFDIQRAEVARNRAEELRQAALEFEDIKIRGEIQANIKRKYGLQFTLIKKQQVKAELDAEKELADKEIEIRQSLLENRIQVENAKLEAAKNNEDKLVDILVAGVVDETLVESQKTQLKLDIQKKYYADLIKLTQQQIASQRSIDNDTIKNLEEDIRKNKEKKFDTTNKEIALEQFKSDVVTKNANNELRLQNLLINAKAEEIVTVRQRNDQLLAEEQDLIRRQGALSETDLKLRKARNSTILRNQIETDRQLLAHLKANGREYTKEFEELQQKIVLAEQEALKQRRLENISYFESVSNAVFSATNQIIDAKIQEVDRLNDLQQKRVDAATDIADEGNAELLELEKKRLDEITKQREKFVRDQQALATLELVANTAITVSKAAAEGGAGAAFTIAAALIALTAGLVSAKQIAQNAAFYKGGEFEGYTGDGNPTQESKAVGNKPYTYHKREFIFNHQTTDKYLDIFRKVHAGDLDLRAMEQKAKMFDAMKRDFNINNPYIIKNMQGVTGDRMNNVEKLLGELIKVTNEKEPASFSLDQDGLHFGLLKYGNRKQKIDKLAR